jgi:hypothetical protein
MKTSFFLSTSLLLLASSSLLAGGDGRQVEAELSVLESHVLSTPASGVPVFVPEGLLTEAFVAELRSDDEGPFNYFSDALRKGSEAREAGLPPRCEYVAGETGGPPNQVGPTITEYASTAPVAVVAEVTNLVPGWNGKSVGTMIYARVLEIIACNELKDQRRVQVGDIVSTSVAVGKIEVDGVTLCDKTEQAVTLPDPGSKVLLTGLPISTDAYFLGGSQPFFLITGDRVEPQRYDRIRFEAVPLVNFTARGQVEACGGAG